MSFKMDAQAVEGEAYVRCHQIVVDNPLGGEPRITFSQEQILTVGGQNRHLPLPPATMDFDPEGVIPLLDPDTGEPTGATITQGEAHALLYSTYAAARAPAPIEEE